MNTNQGGGGRQVRDKWVELPRGSDTGDMLRLDLTGNKRSQYGRNVIRCIGSINLEVSNTCYVLTWKLQEQRQSGRQAVSAQSQGC